MPKGLYEFCLNMVLTPPPWTKQLQDWYTGASLTLQLCVIKLSILLPACYPCQKKLQRTLGQGLRTWTKRKGTRGFDLPLRGILSGMLFWALDYGTAGWWEDIAAQAPHVNGQLGKSKTTPCRRVNRRLVSGHVRLCEEEHSASDSWDCQLKLQFFLTNFKLSFCIKR